MMIPKQVLLLLWIDEIAAPGHPCPRGIPYILYKACPASVASVLGIKKPHKWGEGLQRINLLNSVLNGAVLRSGTPLESVYKLAAVIN